MSARRLVILQKHFWVSSSSTPCFSLILIGWRRGCKCLELDCWDDSIGYPVVYHGYTLTSKIPFQAIITCVKGYIDANPDTLPIVLSLENHCSHIFQERIADILTDTLKDCLYVPESSGQFVSPLDLVGKVVVKGKRPPENDEDDLTSSESLEEDVQDLETLFEDALVDGVSSQVEESSLLRSKSSGIFKQKTPDGPQLPKIVPELAKLTLFNGVKHKDLGTSIELPLTDMHSFSETKLLKVLNKDPANVSLLREYNTEHMTRTYPAGSRVDSSNCEYFMTYFQHDNDSIIFHSSNINLPIYQITRF